MALQCLPWSVLGLCPPYSVLHHPLLPATGHLPSGIVIQLSAVLPVFPSTHKPVCFTICSCTNFSWVPPSWTLPWLCWALASKCVCLCRKGSSALGKALPAGQRSPGGHTSPSLSTGEATSEVLWPVLGPPVKQKYGHTGESPAKGHKHV